MLTNYEIEDLAKRMNVPLEYVGYKDLMPTKIKHNKTYILNMSDEEDEGNGSHWVGFQVNINKDKYLAMYFDSYGNAPPELLKKLVKDNFDVYLNFSTKNIQSIVANVCGYYVLAWSHFINVYKERNNNIIVDTADFLMMFDDLEKVNSHDKNEYVLKLFFQSTDDKKRIEPDVLVDSNVDFLKDKNLIKINEN